MDLYRIYNLPALHSELKYILPFVLQGQYLSISASVTYAAIPILHEIHIGPATQGHLYILNSVLKGKLNGAYMLCLLQFMS